MSNAMYQEVMEKKREKESRNEKERESAGQKHTDKQA